MKKTLLWLDDLRNPENYIDVNQYDVIWIHSYQEFVDYFNTEKHMPDVIWFDHDLGEDDFGNILPNGYDCAKFLIDWCEETGLSLPEYHTQSQNPVGRENIFNLLYNYERFKKEN